MNDSIEFVGTRCLVTGGAGFIGSNLTRELLERGARVTVLDNFATGKRENLPAGGALRIVEGDVVSSPVLHDLVGDVDYIFHLAAQVGNLKSIEQPEQDAATNILGAVRLLHACRGISVRKLVYSSSSAIFGDAEQWPIDETHPHRPASFYALSKLTGERYSLLATSLWRVPVVCLRYFNVFGHPMEYSEYSGVISIFFDRLQAGLPLLIYGDGSQVRDFVYVADVVRANLLAAKTGPAGGVYNIGSGAETTILGLAEIMIEMTGKQSHIVFDDFRPGEVRRSLANVSKARTELGFAPRYDLRRGLAEMWERMSAAVTRS